MGMSFVWESHGKRPMGWDRHKLLWDGNGTDRDNPRLAHGNVIPMGIPWETSHGMGPDRHKLQWEWTTLRIEYWLIKTSLISWVSYFNFGVEVLFWRLSPQKPPRRRDWISVPSDRVTPDWGMEGDWYGSGWPPLEKILPTPIPGYCCQRRVFLWLPP